MEPGSTTRRITWRGLALAGAALAGAVSLGATGTAEAGQCPADKVAAAAAGSGAAAPAGAATAPKGVTDTVLASIDLAREAANIEGRLFRLRRLVVEPGGVVPWHDHGNRPALIYVVSGEIAEYANTCSVPIMHRGGEVAMESRGLGHWWKNTGRETVVLLSADLFPTGADGKMM